MAENNYTAGVSSGRAEDSKENDYAKRVREIVQAGIAIPGTSRRSQEFATMYGQKYRLNSTDRQWYPAEPEYDAMQEPEAYWTRLLGECAAQIGSDNMRPGEVTAVGVSGKARVTLNTTHKIFWMSPYLADKYSQSEAASRTVEPEAGNPGVENWEKAGLGAVPGIKSISEIRTAHNAKTAREMYNDLEERVEKRMRGLRALLYEVDRETGEERKEAMEEVLKEVLRMTSRRLAAIAM